MDSHVFSCRLAAIALGILAASGPVPVQRAVPDFSGEWILDVERTKTLALNDTILAGADVAEPKKLRDFRPPYPPMAQSIGVSGVVAVEAVVDGEGRIADLRVIHSIPQLDRAALVAVSQWQYAPTLRAGTPVEVIMTLTVTFAMSGRERLDRDVKVSPYARGGFVAGRVRIEQNSGSLRVTRVFEGYEESSAYRFDGVAVQNQLARTGSSRDGNYAYSSSLEGDSLLTTIAWQSPEGARQRREVLTLNGNTLMMQLGPASTDVATSRTSVRYIFNRIPR